MSNAGLCCAACQHLCNFTEWSLCSVYCLILAPPFINVQASPNQVFSYIGNIKPTYVSCTFGGYPKPWVVMTFRKKLKSNATARANVSVITDAKAKFGYFHCQAKNIYGVKNQTIELKEVGM